MATTTCTISLNSTDILSQAISLSSSTTLYKDSTTSTGLEQMNYHRAKYLKVLNLILYKKALF